MVRYSEYSSRGGTNITKSDHKDILYDQILDKRMVHSSKTRSNQSIMRRNPIPYSRELARSIKLFIKEHLDTPLENLPSCRDLPFPIDFCYEIKRFLLAMKAYQDSPEHFNGKIPIGILLDGIMDIDFAKRLKLFRSECFLKTIRGGTIAPSDSSKIGIDPYEIFDIGQIFNYNYWIFWLKEDPEDYKYGQINEEIIDSTLLSRFKEGLRNNLPEFVPGIKQEEVLLENSSSTAIDLNFKSSAVFKEKEIRNNFSNSPLFGKRTLIPVSTENFRDSILLTVPQSNSVKLFEKQLNLLCQDLGGSTHFKDPALIHKAVKKIGRKYSFFYDRDFTKEGITKPRQLILAILEVLEEKYPLWPCWQYKGIFSNYSILIGDKILTNLRGHGLGMGNSLTTIMQVAVNSLVLEECAANEQSLGENFYFFTFNDDYTAAFQSENDMETFIEYDLDICRRLQLIPKPEKSHKGQGFVFCEIYYPYELNDKESYKLTEIYNIFLFDNIVEAKEYFSSIQFDISNQPELFQRIISYFGYEFYPDEWKYPSAFGGWFSPRLLGVDLAFYKQDFPREALEAYFACKAKVSSSEIFLLLPGKGKRRKRRKLDKMVYNSPFIQIYGTDLKLPEDISNRLSYMASVLEVSGKYALYKNDHLHEMKYNLLYKRRQENYNNIKFKPILLKDIIDDYINEHPYTDFLIDNEFIIIDIEQKAHQKVEEIYHYEVPNRLLSLLKYYNKDKFLDDIIPYRRSFLGLDSYMSRIHLVEDKFNPLNTLLERQKYLVTSEIDIKQVERESLDRFNINPSRVSTAYSLLTDGQIKYVLYPKRDRDIFVDQNEEKIYSFLHSKLAPIFLKLSEIVGYKKALNLSDEKIKEIMEIPLPVSEEKQETEDIDIFDHDEVIDQRQYKLGDYRQWLDDGSPITNPICVEFQRLQDINNTNRIMNDSDFLSHGRTDQVLFEDLHQIIIKESNLILCQTRPYQTFILEDYQSSEDDFVALDPFEVEDFG